MKPETHKTPDAKRAPGRLRNALLAGCVALGMGVAVVGQSYLLQSTPARAEEPVTATATPKTVLAPISFSNLVKHVRSAVVSIQAKSPSKTDISGFEDYRSFDGTPFERFFRDFMPRRGQRGHGYRSPRRYRASLGSGFFISDDGYVVTNYHVIKDASEVTVITDKGKKYTAKVVGRDAKTDLALIKVDDENKFPFVEFAKTDVEVGDWVVAVGNPFGLGGTVTAGIVSARGRDIGSGPYDDFLQIDASINKGNSGGPTFNLDGKVAGVNTAIYTPNGGSIGIGFAIPASIATDVIDSLKSSGSVTRGYLGVLIQPVTEDIADSIGLKEASGAMVMEVNDGTPAKSAGLKAGDTILKVGDKSVNGPKQLASRIAAYKPGSEVELTIWRDGADKTVTVKLGRLPDKVAAKLGRRDSEDPSSTMIRPDSLLGMELSKADEFDVEDHGVVISDVDPDSVAAEKGLRRGDVILRVAGDEVRSPRDVERAIEKARRDGRRTVLMRVKTRRATRFVGLPVMPKKDG